MSKWIVDGDERRIYETKDGLFLKSDFLTRFPPLRLNPVRRTPQPSHKKRNIFCAALVVSIIFIVYHLDFSKPEIPDKTFSQIFNLQKLPKNLVILSATLNPRYLFVLPFTVASWKRLGVHPIVLLVGQKAAFHSNKQSRKTILLLQEQNAYIQYIEPKKLSPISMSQIVRLFGATLPFSTAFSANETILIASDADLAVFHLNNHIPNISEGRTLHLYNSQCCNPIKVPPMRGDHKVPMYPIGTIAATIKMWREIMGFQNPDIPFNEAAIENYIIKEFGDTFFCPNDDKNPRLVGTSIWFADQSLISYKIHEWLKNPKSMLYKSESKSNPKRIDRNSWPSPMQFSRLKMTSLDDCHQPTAAYMDGEWEKFLPFLQFVFQDDSKLLERFVKYRKDFVYRNVDDYFF